MALTKGRDTTLEGAQAIGERVVANVGRNLTMTSQQDSNDYEREDMSAGIDVAVGTGGGSVSANYNQSDIESRYTTVNEQTGIQAGAGGFDIQVGGHTELTGAAIASTADPSLNRLSTESLSVSDLHNEAAYKASSFGVSVSGGSGGGSVSPSIAPNQSDKAESTTRAGISAGTVDIRNGDQSALDSIDRSVTELQQSGLAEIFDEQKVAERTEMGQVAGEVGFTAVGDFAISRQKDAAGRYLLAQEAFESAQADGDQAGMGAAMSTMANARRDFAAWQDGSANKTALHIVVGGLQAAFGGSNALAGALGAGANESVSGKTDSALLGLAAGLVGGALGGNTGVGAATSLAGYTYNRELHKEEKEALDRLMAHGYDREVINAVACSVAKCWEGAGLGVMAGVVKEQTAAAMAGLTPKQQDEVLSVLRAEAPGLFQYKAMDFVADAWKESPGLQDGVLRAGGALQALGGYGTAVTGTGLVAAGAATCLETGVGCVAATGGWAMLGWGTDQMAAGVTTALSGSSQPTVGGWALSEVTGISPESAEFAYGIAGLTPVAFEAFALNRVVSAESAANAWARGTYTGSSAVEFEGRVFRFTKNEYADTTWDINRWNVADNHRYSGPGVGSVYSGTTVESAAAEVGSYRDWLVAVQPKVLVAGSVKLDRVLDLTDPAALRALGVTREQITRSSHGASGAYDQTQRIAMWAREQGYRAILAPSAQTRSGTNLITFDSTEVRNVKTTHPVKSPRVR